MVIKAQRRNKGNNINIEGTTMMEILNIQRTQSSMPSSAKKVLDIKGTKRVTLNQLTSGGLKASSQAIETINAPSKTRILKRSTVAAIQDRGIVSCKMYRSIWSYIVFR